MKKLEFWFKKNLVINIGKTVAMSYHTEQSRFLMRPKVTYINTEIAYKSDTKLYLQKRVIRSLCGVGTGTSCRELFKGCMIRVITVTSLYVFEVLCFLK